MVVRVKFKGLKIANARGKYYVYRRETGEPLIKGFIGSRAELLQKLEDPEFIQVYNRPRLLKRRAGDFPIETLGGFVHWYTCGAIDDAKEGEVDGYPKWWKLAKSTRDDYLDAFDYLRPEFDIVLKDITQPALYEVRDTCANDKWARFADQMIAAGDADIVVEASRLPEPQPMLKTEWIKRSALVVPYGTMSAVELSLTDIMDKIVVDDWGQCRKGLPFGALRQHVDSGRLHEGNLHAELGQIVAGKRPGRASDDETILFWHRGLSITDIGLGHAMLIKANSMKTGQVLRFA